MSEISRLSPKAVWEIFDLICSIPHPSGHETALCRALMDYAVKRGLSCRLDSVGNLRIDRPASPGFENAPTIIFQGHMDMVPLAEDESFDFVTTPITPWIDGDVIRAKGTTLGADDGAGLALALAVLTDPELKCGALAALFTVNEEVGLTGAGFLQPDMLDGKYLINLDSGGHQKACIGCAGGARQEFVLIPEYADDAAGKTVVQITIEGLQGGHSGSCIHMNRGNAIKSLAEFLLQFPELELIAFNGGGADNAIPHEASARVCNVSDIDALRQAGKILAALLAKEHPGSSPVISVSVIENSSDKILSADCKRKVLESLALAPHGVIEMDEVMGIVKTSSNLAAVFTENGQIRIRTSQRSLVDQCREEASMLLAGHFERYGIAGTLDNVYPGWEPQPDSTLVKCCARVWKEFNGGDYQFNAIHAGLETGIIGKKNPELEMIAIGPGAPGCHTPQEYLSIPEMSMFFEFLKLMVKDLSRQL